MPPRPGDANGTQRRGAAAAAAAAAAGRNTSAPLPNPLALLAAGSDAELLGALAVARDPAPLLPPAAPARVRSFPHVVGNFPTVVLLPVQGMDEQLDGLYRRARRLLPDLEPMAQEPGPEAGGSGAPAGGRTGGGGGAPAAHRGYHISLSRTVAIRQQQIAPLTALLAERLGAAVASPFPVSLCGLRSFANDEGSRSFLAVMATQGDQQVPLPHVSVGWLPSDQRPRLDAALRRLDTAAARPATAAPAAAGPVAAVAAGGGGAGVAGGCLPAGPAGAVGDAGGAAGEVAVCSWQASRAVCVVGQRQYEVWRPGPH
ncbi:hypothetical protein TSOC_008861 [Tetrabaena socialis]|uniref:U6 snRNA phosphodiesterase 1 n=1 Tax=Tetrabaena socialis TaxID=47790 RepID=A0A2J7ZXB0_9CHLO|nr:hypothetical protein TSOC_008861 [Tetrabaena socialis]|eukprot:PNH04896.1 hypothetical protein TSOC_008861 [Tetrabaena socialis]